MLKGGGICNIVDKTAAIRSSIEGWAQRLEPLLTCSVPYLHYYHVVVNLNLFVWEICTNSRPEMLRKSCVLKHLNQGSFPNGWISNHYNLSLVLSDSSSRYLGDKSGARSSCLRWDICECFHIITFIIIILLVLSLLLTIPAYLRYKSKLQRLLLITTRIS